MLLGSRVHYLRMLRWWSGKPYETFQRRVTVTYVLVSLAFYCNIFWIAYDDTAICNVLYFLYDLCNYLSFPPACLPPASLSPLRLPTLSSRFNEATTNKDTPSRHEATMECLFCLSLGDHIFEKQITSPPQLLYESFLQSLSDDIFRYTARQHAAIGCSLRSLRDCHKRTRRAIRRYEAASHNVRRHRRRHQRLPERHSDTGTRLRS